MGFNTLLWIIFFIIIISVVLYFLIIFYDLIVHRSTRYDEVPSQTRDNRPIDPISYSEHQTDSHTQPNKEYSIQSTQEDSARSNQESNGDVGKRSVCSDCGKLYEEGQKVCANCGKNLNER